LRNFALADLAPVDRASLGQRYECPQLRTIRSSFAGKLQNFPQKI
jgi:hypothetical protein